MDKLNKLGREQENKEKKENILRATSSTRQFKVGGKEEEK